MSRLPAPLLLLWLLLQLNAGSASSEQLGQCSSRREATQCLVTGQLTGSCPQGVTSLFLGFNGADASWPASGSNGGGGGGLSDCDSVGHLKVTGWSGPELTSGHLRQLRSLGSADIVDGGIQTVGANVCSNKLTELSLARNKIYSIHELSLSHCASLISLDLSDNSIDQLPDRFLINCRSLRTVRLSGNRLAELRSDALLGAMNLRELLMQKNRFQMLHKVELGFINSPRLSLIDLRNNGLFSYQAGRRGFCGPANVTVRMHHAGCPPQPDTCAVEAAAAGAVRSECVGSSAQLIVTFTSCQVAVGCSQLSPWARAPLSQSFTMPAPTPALAPIPTIATVTKSRPSPTVPSTSPQPPPSPPPSPSPPPDVHSLMLRSLGLYPEGVWLLYTLTGTAAFALVLLVASLCVCHRLKLRIARLESRGEPLLSRGDMPSLRNFHTLYSQSVMSGRATPSGKDHSSHCGDGDGDGASQCELPCEQMEMQRMLDRDSHPASEAPC